MLDVTRLDSPTSIDNDDVCGGPSCPMVAIANGGGGRYEGPERRAMNSQQHWLTAMLDEIDYGMLLLRGGSRVIHNNHAARAELDDSHPLHVHGHELRARCTRDAAMLAAALRAAAQRGLRKLLTLGEGDRRASVSVVPLPASSADPTERVTLVILGKRQVCEGLSVHGFAHSHCLTNAETRVLAALCKGLPPAEIALQLGVAISTIRTQIGAIRVKTNAESIRALVGQVAVLPPLMGALRGPAALDIGHQGLIENREPCRVAA